MKVSVLNPFQQLSAILGQELGIDTYGSPMNTQVTACDYMPNLLEILSYL